MALPTNVLDEGRHLKPTIKLATANTPDGGNMTLYQHDRDYSIQINGHELMNSRQHESELELARLGCAHLSGLANPHVLIGGLGMGYTLRQTLDMLGHHAKVTVSELLPAVVDWNHEYLGSLNSHPLKDERTEIVIGDIYQILLQSKGKFDAILLDIDNGPEAIVDSGNQRLYDSTGIQLCRRALRKNGRLAIWSGNLNNAFEQNLMNGGFHVRRYSLRAYKNSRKESLFVWVASENKINLPK